MAIDPTIALGFRPPEQPSQLNMLGQVLALQNAKRQNQLGQMQIEGMRSSAEQQGRLRNYLAGNDVSTPEGQAALSRAFPLEAPKIIEGHLDLQQKRGAIKKSEADARAADFKLKQDQINVNLQALAGVNTPEQAAQWIQGGLRAGLIDMRQASGALAEMQQAAATPQGFAQWKQSQQAAGMTIAQQMDRVMKEREFALSKEKFEETKRSNRVTEGISAGNLGVAKANLGLRQKELEAGGKPSAGYVMGPPDENGRPTWVPIRGGPADPTTKRGGEPTEDEKRSAGLAVRMEAALKKVAEVTATAPSAAKPEITAEVLRGLPLIGEPLANTATSADRQRVDTAQIDALDAALTLATGAAYTKEQLRGLAKSYFPQIGDDEATVADKNERLKTVVESARIRAGRSAGNIDAVLNKPGPQPPGGVKFLGFEN